MEDGGAKTTGQSRRGKNWGALQGLTEPELRRLYETELLTDAEIGARYDATGEGVAYKRKRWGISTITARQRREKCEARPGPSLDDLTPSELADLYSRMGDRQIAALYGVRKPAIARLRERWGIQGTSKSERATSKDSLTDEQKEIVIGTLLGDAHLLKRGVYKLSHADFQYEYLCRVHAALRSIARPFFYEEKTTPLGEVCPGFGFRSVQHAWLKSMRDLFYPKGEKVFPPSILENLSERSLAYWYFDDGGLSDGLPLFALGDFSEVETARIVAQVGDRFGFQTYVSPKSTASCSIMSMRAVSTERFFRMVVEFATPDMLYKIPERYWPSDLVSTRWKRTKEHVDLPKSLRERCATPEEDESLIDDLVTFWREKGFPHHVARPEHLLTLSRLEQTQVLHGNDLKARQVGQSSCQAFMPHIWEARSYKQPSPRELFDTSLPAVLERALEKGIVPTAPGLRRALRLYRLTGVYSFRPSVAKVLVDRYCQKGGVVFDPCGGWGGRLMGTLLSSVRATYVCCEPSSRTVRGLFDLKGWIGAHVPGAEERAQIHGVPAEEMDVPACDMVLTSPPYWRRETYADEPTQAGQRYATYQAWLEGFWRPTLEKCVEALRPGGWLVLNVDDFVLDGVAYTLVQDTVDLVSALGLKESERYRYMMPSPTKDENYEWVLAWVKGSARIVDSADPLEVEIPTVQRATEREPVTKLCEGCRQKFSSFRSDARFCSDACGARVRRRKKPGKRFRDATCQRCGKNFQIPLTGGVRKHCAVCEIAVTEKTELQSRTKTCQYRECGRSFLDASKQNSSKFCHPEHRRREKLFRTGKVSDARQFRNSDPVLK